MRIKATARSRETTASSLSITTNVAVLIILHFCTFVTSDVNIDLRIVPYESLLLDSSTQLFEDTRLSDYSQIVIDYQRRQIILGLRNYLARVHLDNLDVIEIIEWSPDSNTRSVCAAKGQHEFDCHNYVRVLLLHNDVITACGTFAYGPLCSTRKARSISDVISWSTGVTKCPYNPRQNNTYVMTSQGDFFSGTVTDFTGRDAAIYRIGRTTKPLRTAQYNSRWLNEPDFVSSYEIGDYVYFFFREAAIEYINCGKAVYSRVARICKNDNGGKLLLKDNWTTFVKARLNCSLPGAYPFYFNELQSTYFLEQEQLIYAVFTTSPTSIYGSAICVYNFTAIDDALRGPYKYQESAQSAWTRVPNSSPDKCGMAMDQTSVSIQRRLVEVQKYQMMDNAVQPENEFPALVVEKQRFTHIVVDQVDVVANFEPHSVAVAFLATLEGAIHKYTLQTDDLTGKTVSCLVEVLHVVPNDLPQPIRAMKLNEKPKSLIIGTNQRLYRIPTQRCHRFVNEKQCINVQDPYCGWDSFRNLCAPIGHTQFSSMQCSELNIAVDGEWSDWSPWEPCSGYNSPSERCVCRSRSCDQPKPRFGGLNCLGDRIQVANCSVDGQWSEWSSWSSCSNTERHSETATRTRQRSCSSPAPRHGGRACSGDTSQIEICSDSLLFNVNTISDDVTLSTTGRWSVWTEWTPCSAKCGDGQQSRRRICLSGSETQTKFCNGEDLQMRTCYVQPCPVARRKSQWSAWYEVRNDSAYHEQRWRCVCRAGLPDVSVIRSPEMITETRQCAADRSNCVNMHRATMTTSAAPSSACPKCSSESKHQQPSNDVEKENSIIDKDFLSDGSYEPTRTHRSVVMGSAVGYCYCRDLGNLRVCRRCPRFEQRRIATQTTRSFDDKDVGG